MMSAAKGGTGFTHEAPVDGKTVEWYTPAAVFEWIGLQFDLDPCAPPGGLHWIPAEKFYSIEDDGLTAPWAGKVFCNPPYGPQTRRWLKRMCEHHNGVALVFARTDTKWFHESAVNADAVLFLEGRIQFVNETGEPPKKWNEKKQRWEEQGPGCGSMLVAWGNDCAQALLNMKDRGLFVDLATNRRAVAARILRAAA